MSAPRALPVFLPVKERKQGAIFVVSGPSGCGKTTLCAELLKQDKYLVRSVSMTTRKPRGLEKDSRDYIYTSIPSFRQCIRKECFLEHALVFGNYYGTPKRFIEKALRQGKDVLLNIDVQGAVQVKRNCKDAILIFIVPPSIKELENRLKGRLTDTSSQVRKRLGVAREEIKYIKRYDYCVVNDRLQGAVDALRHIIIAQRHRV